MHQLGLSAADLTSWLHERRQDLPERLAARTHGHRAAGHPPEEAARLALFDTLAELASDLLEANNRKLATDLVRLGVLAGTISRDGEASF